MIAGYITATTVDLARVKELHGEIRLYDRMTFKAGDYSDFDSLLATYVSRTDCDARAACFGVAGPVIDNEVVATNLPWRLKGTTLARKFSFERCTIVNDLVATARGLFLLKEDKFFTINKGIAARQGNIGLVAAGAGLGQALILYSGDKYIPFASEGGHSGFTPGSQLEVGLWEYIYAQQGYVEAEDVVSSGGLEQIFRFLVEHQRSVLPDWYKKSRDKVSAIIEKALSGQDEIATQTLELFVDCLATEVANVALKGMTVGGIYLVGHLAPQLITFIDKVRFMERLVQMGKMNLVLSGIPVKVSLDAKTAHLGAAALALTL